MDTDDIVRRTAANRRRAADLLDGLSPEQWGDAEPVRRLDGARARRPLAHAGGDEHSGRGFVPAGRLTGLTLGATDQEWRSGDGPEVAGPSEALALAMAGRPVALADLDGDGLPVLRTGLAAA